MDNRISCEKSNDIVEIIKNIIYKYHPIVDNRLNSIINYNKPEMEIGFKFFNKNNIDQVSVDFLDGTYYSKNYINESFIIEGFLCKETLINLMNFILSDHEIIKSFTYDNQKICFTFTVNCTENNLKGINCGDILLNLDFSFLDLNREETADKYLYCIIDNFYEYIKNTNQFKKDYDEFINEIKTDIIEALDKEELIQFMNLLNEQEMRNVLYKISDNRFVDLFESYDEKKLVKKI